MWDMVLNSIQYTRLTIMIFVDIKPQNFIHGNFFQAQS